MFWTSSPSVQRVIYHHLSIFSDPSPFSGVRAPASAAVTGAARRAPELCVCLSESARAWEREKVCICAFEHHASAVSCRFEETCVQNRCFLGAFLIPGRKRERESVQEASGDTHPPPTQTHTHTHTHTHTLRLHSRRSRRARDTDSVPLLWFGVQTNRGLLREERAETMSWGTELWVSSYRARRGSIITAMGSDNGFMGTVRKAKPLWERQCMWTATASYTENVYKGIQIVSVYILYNTYIMHSNRITASQGICRFTYIDIYSIYIAMLIYVLLCCIFKY